MQAETVLQPGTDNGTAADAHRLPPSRPEDWKPDLLSGRILIVDDEPANVLLLTKILRAEGYREVTSTTDPREALRIYGRTPQDLVLLDIRMPHLDGFQVMEALSAMEPGSYPPVLVLTAQTDMATRLRALQAGARDFVNKPIDRTEVLNRIRNMLEVRLLYNRLRGQNEVLEVMVEQRTRQLADSRLEVVRRLGRAAEYRDNETGLHILRMSKIAAGLARQAGLSAADCDLILNAAPMHDIGKIGIPDSILRKPGKLDSLEWETMKAHTTIGAEILAGHDSDLMRMARDIALYHHERWDGSGYPHGLAGEAIPLSARITAIADVFDALTSERPYKRAWPLNEAMAEIERAAGTHFDPALAACFAAIPSEVAAIIAEHREPPLSPRTL